MTVKMYLLWFWLGKGRLKSRLSRSNGCVALITYMSFGVKYCGLHSEHILHVAVIRFTSSSENDKLRIRAKCSIRVTPG